VSDGIRTRDIWDHNPVLYQLSYTHHGCRVLIPPPGNAHIVACAVEGFHTGSTLIAPARR
jgi:hypothetical protein